MGQRSRGTRHPRSMPLAREATHIDGPPRPNGGSGETRLIAGEHLGPWDPLSPEKAAALLAGIGAPWWLAGGWAIDLHIGRQTRAHADLDILILRPDQLLFRSLLRDWDVQAADPPGSLRPWPAGETLPPEVHDVWCRPDASNPWSFQFMIDDVDGEDWLFRRNRAVRRPIASLTGRASLPGTPLLSPEIQLLYKSKGMREKDVADFGNVVPYLNDRKRDWLRQTLRFTRPDHPWTERL